MAGLRQGGAQKMHTKQLGMILLLGDAPWWPSGLWKALEFAELSSSVTWTARTWVPEEESKLCPSAPLALIPISG